MMIQYPSGSGYLPDFFIIGSYFVFAFTCSITFVQVSFPQIPSAVSFTFFWNAFKDVSVSFPKSPSTFTPSIACSIDTAVPLLPFWITGSWTSIFPVNDTVFFAVFEVVFVFVFTVDAPFIYAAVFCTNSGQRPSAWIRRGQFFLEAS